MRKLFIVAGLLSLFIIAGCAVDNSAGNSAGNNSSGNSIENNSQSQANNTVGSSANENTTPAATDNSSAGSNANGSSSASTNGSTSGSTGTSTGTPMNMEPQTPPALTAEQQKQLDAGKASHEPTTLTFDVVGGNFYYTPNEIRVKKGDTVKIVFKNAGGFHNFVLDEFNVKTNNINGGETAEVEFLADKAGSFEYYCSVGKHRQMGQKGTLIVEE